MHFKTTATKSILLGLSGLLCLFETGCRRQHTPPKSSWVFYCKPDLSLDEFKLTLNGMPLGLSFAQKTLPSVALAKVAEAPVISEVARLAISKGGQIVMDVLLSLSAGNRVIVSRNESGAPMIKLAEGRYVSVTKSYANETHLDVSLLQEDVETGRSVILDIPDFGPIHLKVPANQWDVTYSIAVKGYPTQMIHQVLAN